MLQREAIGWLNERFCRAVTGQAEMNREVEDENESEK
jgi:hypothetical protein